MLKKILIAIGLGILPPAAAYAQAAPGSLAALGQWLGTQQAQVGTAFGFDKSPAGKPVQYAALYWDAASLGQSGINIGAATALDYIDLSFGTAAANNRPTRYGVFVPLHVGNAWNSLSSHLPAKIADHVYFASLPNVTVALAAYEPTNGILSRWTIKKDGQISVAYRFGGAPTDAAGKLAIQK